MTMRLFVDTGSWKPEAVEFSSVLSLLPLDAQNEVLLYAKAADRERALCSRLLVRHVVSKVCEVGPNDVLISITKGGKKFSLNPSPRHSPNFNFNVSHDGRYTAIASENHCIVGVDVCSPLSARREEVTLGWLRSSFNSQLTPSEWADVEAKGAVGKVEMEDCFQRYWSLKESYVKARGDGLGFGPLSRAEFTLFNKANDEGCCECNLAAHEATVKVDGVSLSRWRFSVEVLGSSENTGSKTWVAVALGPPEGVVDELGVFKGTFRQLELTDTEMQVRRDY